MRMEFYLEDIDVFAMTKLPCRLNRGDKVWIDEVVKEDAWMELMPPGVPTPASEANLDYIYNHNLQTVDFVSFQKVSGKLIQKVFLRYD